MRRFHGLSVLSVQVPRNPYDRKHTLDRHQSWPVTTRETDEAFVNLGALLTLVPVMELEWFGVENIGLVHGTFLTKRIRGVRFQFLIRLASQLQVQLCLGLSWDNSCFTTFWEKYSSSKSSCLSLQWYVQAYESRWNQARN